MPAAPIYNNTNGFDSSNQESTGIEVSETTAFVADDKVVTSQVPQTKELQLFKLIKTPVADDIAAFLGRPYAVQTGILQATDVSTTFTKLYIPYDILNSNGNAPINIWINKLLGYRYIKFDIEFRVVVNATRFNSGIYRLVWVPYAGAGVNTQFDLFHSATATQTTQLPHVELNLSCDTEASLTIPWTYALTHYTLFQAYAITSDSVLGRVYLWPYVPLDIGGGGTGAPTSVPYTIFVSLKNIDLTGPTVPQMGGFADDELGEMKPLSGGLKLIGEGFGQFARLPPLTGIFKSAQWVMNAASGAALAVGFSKPNDPVTQRVTRRTITNMAVTDTKANAEPLSLFSSNSVTTAAFGKDIDEMSFKYLLSIPAYIQRVNWTTANSAGYNMMTLNVGPIQGRVSVTDNSNSAYVWAPVAYFNNMFMYWRGSITFTFKLAKTEFHSGRLCVAFMPYNSNVIGSYTGTIATDAPYLYREIVDIRYCTKFSVTVPYICNSPFSNPADYVGKLYVYIIDPLVAPATVSSTVTMVVEMAAGPDFQLAGPVGYSKQIYFPTVFQSGWTEFQSGWNVSTTNTDDCRITALNLGFTPVDNLQPAEYCVGESVSNVRSLIKRYGIVCPSAAVSRSPNWYQIWNAAIPVAIGDTIHGASVTPLFWADSYAFIASCFALARGGFRFAWSVDNSSNHRIKAFLSRTQVATAFISQNGILVSQTDGSGTQMYTGSTLAPVNDGLIEVSTPMYHLNPAWAIGDCFTNESSLFGNVPSPYWPQLTTTFSSAGPSTNNLNFYRAAADDHQFCCFVSTPMTYTSNGGVVNINY